MARPRRCGRRRITQSISGWPRCNATRTYCNNKWADRKKMTTACSDCSITNIKDYVDAWKKLDASIGRPARPADFLISLLEEKWARTTEFIIEGCTESILMYRYFDAGCPPAPRWLSTPDGRMARRRGRADQVDWLQFNWLRHALTHQYMSLVSGHVHHYDVTRAFILTPPQKLRSSTTDSLSVPAVRLSTVALFLSLVH